MGVERCLLLMVMILFFGCKNSIEKSINYQSVSPINSDSTINMVVEIPTGTTAKYEMNKSSYTLQIDSINGGPRYIEYLGYPGNYGMIPNTILPKSQGGDGDPLDVLLLGESVERGSIQKVHIVGVLELLDNGEQDDKLIAIDPQSIWSTVKNINDLDAYFPGAKSIIETFFENYKGAGKMKIKGWSDRSTAMDILKRSIQQ